MLTKDQIRSAKDRPREWVPIQEWTPAGETFNADTHGLFVGALSARAKDAWEYETFSKKPEGEHFNHVNARARLAVLTGQNEDGSRFFDDSDIEWLGDKGAPALQRIYDAAMRVNRMTAQDHEELVKGF